MAQLRKAISYVSLATLVTCSVGVACSSDSAEKSGAPGSNFAGGTQPLELNPAPPGLCSGDGSQKECADPGGCQPPGGGGGPPGGGGGFGTGGAGGGGNGFGGSGGGGEAGGAGAGGFGGSAGTAGTGGPVSDAGTDADACEPDPDGGVPPGCPDAGAEGGAQQLVLHPQAAPACSEISSATPATLFLSADDSNSTASPVIARRLIRIGQDVPPWIVRPYEFLNYYDFDFEPAKRGDVRIVPQLSSCPKDGELSFQVALQSEKREPRDRAPLNITFVLDTSGSMGSPNWGTGDQPIELERTAVLAVASQLQEGDIVSMVTWSTSQDDILVGHVASGPNDPVVVAAANSFEAGGGTDLYAGLTHGYEVAEQNYSKDRINRLLLISDGQANVGVTEEELIGRYADDEEGDAGIYLSGVGVGDGVNDTLMNVVTDAGRGAYVYVDSHDEAQKMLGDRFLPVIDLAARGVRLEITLPWYLKVAKFFGEQISTDPTKVRPQHLGPNDAMLFFQVLEACDPALIHGDDRIRMRATWERPFTREKRDAVIDTTLNALAGDDANLTKAAAIAGYAEALIGVGTGEGNAAEILGEALQNVRDAKGAGVDPDLVEVEELLVTYLERYGG